MKFLLMKNTQLRMDVILHVLDYVLMRVIVGVKDYVPLLAQLLVVTTVLVDVNRLMALLPPIAGVKVIVILVLVPLILELLVTLTLLVIAIMAAVDVLEIAQMLVVGLAEVVVKQIVVLNQLLQLKDLTVLDLAVLEPVLALAELDVLVVREPVKEAAEAHVRPNAPDVLAIVLVLAAMVVKVVLVRVAEVVNINVVLVQVVLEGVADVILVVQAALLVAQMNVADVAAVQEVAVQRARDVILLAKQDAPMLVQIHALQLVNKTAMLLAAIAAKE